mmetsp:Transcript_32566/g.56371  ORF Transcript_32566/g.56371 Transcript_32566/m.56371 type:complete len:546 (-) Transcript_32566:2286-3923(-)
MISTKETGPSLLHKALGFTGLMLLLSSSVLTIYSLELGSWFSFSNAASDYKFGLIKCEDCPGTYKEWSTDCFADVACDAKSSSTWCSRWTMVNGASNALYYMEYFSLLSTALLLERVLFKLMNRFMGMNLISYILAGLSAVLHLVAIGQWFAITGAKFDDSCHNDEDELKICAEQGAIVNLAALGTCILGCAASTLFLKFSPAQDGSLYKIEGRRTFLLTKVFPVLLITLFFDIFSINWHWTYFENTKKHHNFLNFADKYKNYENYGHNCITSSACEAEYKITSTKRECKAFGRLQDAGEFLRKFKLAEFVFAALWLECMSYCCTYKEFGIPLLQYAWPFVMIVTQVIALSGWAAISGSGFTNNCQVLSLDKDIDFCSDTSVIFTILGIIINCIAIASFIIVYINRYDFKVKVKVYDEKSVNKMKFANKLNGIDDTFNHSTSINSSALEDSTAGPDSRSITPNLRERASVVPSILEEQAPLSKRNKKKDPACSLCHKSLWGENTMKTDCAHSFHVTCFELYIETNYFCPDCGQELSVYSKQATFN